MALNPVKEFPPPPPGPLKIHYRDKHLVVVEKPAWLLSVPGKNPQNESVVGRMRPIMGEVFVVHRLDWATSGLLILALTPEATKGLNRQFREREVKKQYRALVSGIPSAGRGEISVPLSGDRPHLPRQKVDFEKGKPALTRWELLDIRPDGSSLILLIPVSGRTHQLRVHMNWLGHPIIGDRIYSKDRLEAADLPRMCLHATELTFAHPATGEKVNVSSDCPFT